MPRSEKTTTGELVLILGVAVAAAVGMSLWIRSAAPQREPTGGIEVGRPAPEIAAGHWVNGEPTGEPGVKVVHAWFTTCQFCWSRSHEVVALHDQYGDRVEFIGLAPEEEDERAAVEDFIAKNKFTWPNGFAARPTLLGLETQAFPARWVIDRSGRIIWNGNSREPIESAIERALAEG